MKKEIKKVIHCCDKCNEECGYFFVCPECNIEMCLSCSEIYMKKYEHSVFFSGSRDGHFCNPCDAKLIENGQSKVHNSYRKILSLRKEHLLWWDDFKRRSDNAEKELESVIIK